MLLGLHDNYIPSQTRVHMSLTELVAEHQHLRNIIFQACSKHEGTHGATVFNRAIRQSKPSLEGVL